LALCYWREGAYNEARAILESASALIKEDETLKSKTLLRLADVEIFAGRYGDALRLLTDAASLFDEGASVSSQ
jgi:predicted negative regulator of RcsB-dependent stress response